MPSQFATSRRRAASPGSTNWRSTSAPRRHQGPSRLLLSGRSCALLAATLLAGSLIGAAAYAGIGASIAPAAAVTTTLSHALTTDARDSFRYSRPVSITRQHDSTVARDGARSDLTIGRRPSFPEQRGRFDLR